MRPLRALLLAELRYSLPAWLYVYGFCLLLLVGAAWVPSWGFFSFVMNTSMAYTVMMGVVGLGADEEKRTRANALLPLRPRHVALLDVVYVTEFHLGMVVLWLLLLPFKAGLATTSTFWGMLSHSGLLLSMMTMFGVHTHLGFFGARRYKRVSYLLVLVVAETIAVLIYTGWIRTVARFVARHYMSWTGALFATLLWLALSWLMVVLYERRRSYLS